MLWSVFVPLLIANVVCSPSPAPWNLTVPLLTKYEYSFRRSALKLPPIVLNDWYLGVSMNSILGIRTGAHAVDLIAFEQALPANATSFFVVGNDRVVVICQRTVLFFAVTSVSVTSVGTFAFGKLNFSLAEEFLNPIPLIVDEVIYMGGSNATESYSCSMFSLNKNGTILNSVSVYFDDCNFQAKKDNGTLLFQVRNNDESGWANNIVRLFENFTVSSKFSVVYPNGNIQFLPFNDTVFVFYQEGYVIQFNKTGGALNFLSLNDTCGGLEFAPVILNKTMLFICDSVVMEIDLWNVTLEARFKEPLSQRFSFFSRTPSLDWLLANDVGSLFIYNGRSLTQFVSITKDAYAHLEGVNWITNESFYASFSTYFYGGVCVLMNRNGTIFSQATGQILPVGAPFFDNATSRLYLGNAAPTLGGYNSFVAFDTLISNESFVVDTWANSELSFPFAQNVSGTEVYYLSGSSLYLVDTVRHTSSRVANFSQSLVGVTGEMMMIGEYIAVFDELRSIIQIVSTTNRSARSVSTCKQPIEYVYSPLQVHHGSFWLNCGTTASAAFQRIFPNGTVVNFGTSGGFYPMVYSTDFVVAFTSYNQLTRFNLSVDGSLIGTSWTTTVAATTNPLLVDNIVYTAGDSTLYQINASSGALLTTVGFNQFPRLMCSGVVNGVSVFSIIGEKVSVVSNNSLRFELSLSGVLLSTIGHPIIGNGVLLFFTLDSLYAIDTLSGATLFTKSVNTDASYSPIVVVGGSMIFSDGFSVTATNPISGVVHSSLSYTFGIDALRGFRCTSTSNPTNSTVVLATQSGFVFAGIINGKYANFSGIPTNPPPPTTTKPSTTVKPTTTKPSTIKPTTLVTTTRLVTLPSTTTSTPTTLTQSTTPATTPVPAVTTLTPS
ncbi:Hypothetical protein, putative, partial [Bodo saltans]